MVKRKRASEPLNPFEVEIPKTTLGVWFLSFGDRGCWFGLLSRREEDQRMLLENHYFLPHDDKDGIGHNAQLAPDGISESRAIERAREMFDDLRKKVKGARGFEVLRGGRSRNEFMELLSSMPFVEDEEPKLSSLPSLLSVGAVLAHKLREQQEDPKPTGKRGGLLVIIKPDGSVEKQRWTGKCPLEMLQQGVGGYIERVKVRYQGRVRDAWVNENGISEGLTPNMAAAEYVRPDYLTLGPIFGNLVIQVPDPKPKKAKEEST